MTQGEEHYRAICCSLSLVNSSGLKALAIVQGLIAPVGKIGRQLSKKKRGKKTTEKKRWGEEGGNQ